MWLLFLLAKVVIFSCAATRIFTCFSFLIVQAHVFMRVYRKPEQNR